MIRNLQLDITTSQKIEIAIFPQKYGKQILSLFDCLQKMIKKVVHWSQILVRHFARELGI